MGTGGVGPRTIEMLVTTETLTDAVDRLASLDPDLAAIVEPFGQPPLLAP